MEEKKKFARVMFRLADLEESIASRSDEQSERRYAQIARRDLERLYSLYRQSLPRFSEAEAMVIANALNGTVNRPESVHLLWAEVASYLDERPSQDIDCGGLIERLRSLTRFECMAIADAIERVWNTETYHTSNLPARLRHIGLIVRDGEG